eukprot:Hpha_TRINITY_DN16450_c0_g1::TRINITY_DN16450_c0_g1_i2::g.163824::m.163824
MALVGPGAMTPYGGGGRRRQRGTCVVREPACGFFIAGSSIEDMNGIYGRVARVPNSLKHEALLSYKHDHTQWWMVLVDRSNPDEEDTGGSGRYGELDREWIFLDDRGGERFKHEGDTIIPGAGVRWSKCGAGIQDDDELPWQVIALLDGSVLRDLRGSYIHRQRRIAAAIAGKGLPRPQGECSGGRWVWRVDQVDGVPIRHVASDEGVWVGQRPQGSTLRVTGTKARKAVNAPKLRAWGEQ